MDFNITFNLFGEHKTYEEWEAEEERLEIQNNINKPNKRHRTITEEELNKIEEDKHEKNTKKATIWAVNTLQDFLLSKGMINDISSYNAVALNNMLREFYASVQSSKGDDYSVASLLTLRAALIATSPTITSFLTQPS